MPAQRILLVDDEPAIRNQASRVLRDAGYDVVVAHDGRHALEMQARVLTREPDVILSDLTMPRLDGRGLLRELRARRYRGPVVLMSGYLAGLDEELLKKEGFRGVVPKPFNAEELLRAVRAALSPA